MMRFGVRSISVGSENIVSLAGDTNAARSIVAARAIFVLKASFKYCHCRVRSLAGHEMRVISAQITSHKVSSAFSRLEIFKVLQVVIGER